MLRTYKLRNEDATASSEKNERNDTEQGLRYKIGKYENSILRYTQQRC